MAPKAAFWVHGNAARPQDSGLWLNETHYRWGSNFGTALGPEDPGNPDKHTMWFHIPITTPVFIDGIRPKLVKVFLCYRTKGNSKLKAIHVYDGNTEVDTFDGLSLQGDHPQAPLDNENSWDVKPSKTIYAGLGISAQVWFGLTQNGVIPEFAFYTAGADFVDS
jgi:hypothetical protein